MNKIYAHILLTTVITVSTTCMELQDTRNIQDKKPLLQTNSITQPDNKDLIKNELYTAAEKLDCSFDSSLITTHKSLVNFIMLMNEAKRYNITEDEMGRFIYQQSITLMKEAKPYNITEDDMKRFPYQLSKYYTPVTFYFHCLKKYNATKEKLPFTTDELDNEACLDSDLAQILNIRYTYQSIEDIQNKLASYPAYTNLIDKFKEAQNKNLSHFTLYICLYLGTEILFSDYPQYTNVTDFETFYYKVYDCLESSYDTVYNLINLVARIKSIENKNIVSKILNHNPVRSIRSIYLKVDSKTKNRMALIYKCVEQYNDAQGNKKIPTGKQHKAFLSFKRLDINLPDKFDATLFDENEYEFEKFQILSDNIAVIYRASGAALEQAVKKIVHEI